MRLYPCETGEAETEWRGRLGEGALWGLKEHGKEWDNTQTHHSWQRTAKNKLQSLGSTEESCYRRAEWEHAATPLGPEIQTEARRLVFSIQITRKSSNSESQHSSMHIIELITCAIQLLGVIGCLNVLVLGWKFHKHHAQALKWKRVHLKKNSKHRKSRPQARLRFKLRGIERDLLPSGEDASVAACRCHGSLVTTRPYLLARTCWPADMQRWLIRLKRASMLHFTISVSNVRS